MESNTPNTIIVTSKTKFVHKKYRKCAQSINIASFYLYFRRYRISGSANGSTGNMNIHLHKKHADKLDQSDETEDDTFVSGNLNEKHANISMIRISDL